MALKAAPSRLGRPVGRPAEAVRATSTARGYDRRWQAERRAFLFAHPYCRGCAARGRAVPATVVDHVVPHRGSARLFDDPGNRQAACAWCHNVVKQQLEQLWEAGAIDAAELWLDSPTARRLAVSCGADATL